MRVPLRRALLSVTDKTNLEPLARELFRRRVEIVSTGGTAKQLREWGVPVRDRRVGQVVAPERGGAMCRLARRGSRGWSRSERGVTTDERVVVRSQVRDVSDLTGFPEVLSGRVKSLHPKVHGGLLAVRGNAEHEAQMLAHGIEPIDLVVSNLYAFHDATSSVRGRDGINGGEKCVRSERAGFPSGLCALWRRAGCGSEYLRREHRHRRAVDAPLGREEPRGRLRRLRHAPIRRSPP